MHPDSTERSVSFSDLGFTRKTSTVTTILGKLRHWENITKKEWIFLTVSAISTLISLGLTIYGLATFSPDSPDFTFAILLIANTVFCLYYIIHGVFQESTYEIVVFVITTVIVMIYIIINFVESTNKGTVKIVRLSFIAVLGPINITMGAYLIRKYWESNNLVFRIVGGTEDMQKICRLFFLCDALTVFDFQCYVSALILVLKSGAKVTTTQTVILSIGGVMIVVWPVVSFMATRLESKSLMWIFWISCPLGPSYVIYKFYDTAKTMNAAHDLLYEVIYSAGVLAIVFRIFLILTMVAVYRNFGKGFREKRYSIAEIAIPENGVKT